jgi:hypothetical protein
MVRVGLANLKGTVSRLKENTHFWYYAVESVTNYGGMSLPARYKLSIYAIEKGGGSATNYSKAAVAPPSYSTNFSVEFFGILDKIYSPSDFDVLPAFPPNKRIDVSDGRFRNEQWKVHGIQYSITNQWIMDTRDPRLTSLAEAKYKERQKLEFTPAKAAFFAGLVCFPLLVLVLSLKAIGNKKQ